MVVTETTGSKMKRASEDTEIVTMLKKIRTESGSSLDSGVGSNSDDCVAAVELELEGTARKVAESVLASRLSSPTSGGSSSPMKVGEPMEVSGGTEPTMSLGSVSAGPSKFAGMPLIAGKRRRLSQSWQLKKLREWLALEGRRPMVAPPPPLVADLSCPPPAWRVDFSSLPTPPNPWKEISTASVPGTSVPAAPVPRAGGGVIPMEVEEDVPDEMETPALVMEATGRVVRYGDAEVKLGGEKLDPLVTMEAEDGDPMGVVVPNEVGPVLVKEDPDVKGVKVEEAVVDTPPPPPPVAVEAAPPPPPLVAAGDEGAEPVVPVPAVEGADGPVPNELNINRLRVAGALLSLGGLVDVGKATVWRPTDEGVSRAGSSGEWTPLFLGSRLTAADLLNYKALIVDKIRLLRRTLVSRFEYVERDTEALLYSKMTYQSVLLYLRFLSQRNYTPFGGVRNFKGLPPSVVIEFKKFLINFARPSHSLENLRQSYAQLEKGLLVNPNFLLYPSWGSVVRFDESSQILYYFEDKRTIEDKPIFVCALLGPIREYTLQILALIRHVMMVKSQLTQSPCVEVDFHIILCNSGTFQQGLGLAFLERLTAGFALKEACEVFRFKGDRLGAELSLIQKEIQAAQLLRSISDVCYNSYDPEWVLYN